MDKISKCLKEWNATVEALGQGKQTVLIRTYKTTLKEFLLYPTVSYANKDNYLENFQNKHQSFVKEHALPKKEGNKVEIKYYATLEKIAEKSAQSTSRLRNFYIWTPEHVKSYLKGQKAYIWALRVYELKEPFMAEPTPGAIRYANLKKEVSLEGIKPVLSDAKFSKKIEAIGK
ncbi:MULTISPECIES: DUF1802 family protein [Methanobacterium]|uniref:DUF1802 family protein n=1 Tax=Methanobacterium veterum TaxID=408577 RepID=A0A9E5A5Q5_9EURY|nr:MULTISPECIES: DUF1802 family protein [Methanobacterium]MCZ3367271.1 DUF1802 family protein [Methanobacterium veterum]MCZ3373581.1 DUF1802 family protein [Methanobacterium veterum]